MTTTSITDFATLAQAAKAAWVEETARRAGELEAATAVARDRAVEALREMVSVRLDRNYEPKFDLIVFEYGVDGAVFASGVIEPWVFWAGRTARDASVLYVGHGCPQCQVRPIVQSRYAVANLAELGAVLTKYEGWKPNQVPGLRERCTDCIAKDQAANARAWRDHVARGGD